MTTIYTIIQYSTAIFAMFSFGFMAFASAGMFIYSFKDLFKKESWKSTYRNNPSWGCAVLFFPYVAVASSVIVYQAGLFLYNIYNIK